MKSTLHPNDYNELREATRKVLHAQIQESKIRKTGRVLNLDNFIKERIVSSGGDLLIKACLITEEIEISQELKGNENFNSLQKAVINAMWIENVREKFE